MQVQSRVGGLPSTKVTSRRQHSFSHTYIQMHTLYHDVHALSTTNNASAIIMNGNHKTSSSTQLSPTESLSNSHDCYFNWEQRMGIHFAHHQSKANVMLHSITVPFIVFGFLLLLQQFKLLEISDGGFQIDLGLVFCVLTIPVWYQTDPLCGSTFSILLFAIHYVASILFPPSSSASDDYNNIVYGLLLLLGSIIVQIQVGHGLLESNSQYDDANTNRLDLSEIMHRVFKNPIPVLLVLYYHWIDMFLLLGYKPELRQRIDTYAKQHLQSMATSCEPQETLAEEKMNKKEE